MTCLTHHTFAFIVPGNDHARLEQPANEEEEEEEEEGALGERGRGSCQEKRSATSKNHIYKQSSSSGGDVGGEGGSAPWGRRTGLQPASRGQQKRRPAPRLSAAAAFVCAQPGNYESTVKRTEGAFQACSDIVACFQERARVERQYAQQLSEWSNKWKPVVDSSKTWARPVAAGVREALTFCCRPQVLCTAPS